MARFLEDTNNLPFICNESFCLQRNKRGNVRLGKMDNDAGVLIQTKFE